MKKWTELLEASPVIAAVKEEAALERALKSECGIIFLLCGNLCNIAQMVKEVKEAGKTAIVHIDLIQGLSGKEVAVDYLKQNVGADGMISTRQPLVKYAAQIGLIAIQRTFLVDSMALETTRRQLENYRPYALEIMPGIMPGMIRRIHQETGVPVIAGGLFTEKREVYEALQAGAYAISTTREDLWSA